MEIVPTSTQPITLTKEIKQQIADLVAGGLSVETDKAQIAEAIGIPLETLKELFIKERQDRLLKKAEQTSEEILDIDLKDPNLDRKFSKAKIQIIKTKVNEAQFIRETIGKDIGYSKRSELTGKNGEEIRIKEIIFNPPVFAKAIEHEKD